MRTLRRFLPASLLLLTGLVVGCPSNPQPGLPEDPKPGRAENPKAGRPEDTKQSESLKKRIKQFQEAPEGPVLQSK